MVGILSRRRAIARVARGPMTSPYALRPNIASDVRAGCLALLTGRTAHPQSLAARLIGRT